MFLSMQLSLKIPVVEPVIETAGPVFPQLARRLIVDAYVIPFDVTLQVNCENCNARLTVTCAFVSVD
jgi:hypothetical protein